MDFSLKEFINLFPEYKQWEERKRKLYFHLYFDTKDKRKEVLVLFIKKARKAKLSHKSIAQTFERYFFISQRQIYNMLKNI